MDPNLIKQIEQKLGLLFINEESPNNLCFANDNDLLKDEFKTTFTANDLHCFFKVNINRQIPESLEEFWETVKRGKNL